MSREQELMVNRLRAERRFALERITYFAELLRQEATSEQQAGDGAGTPGNLVRIAGQLECARQRAVSARLALDVLEVAPEV